MSERHHVAIIDDTAVQRMLMARLLEEHYEVVGFPSGESFLDAAPGVDVVLLDIEMPVMGGYETCRRMRQMELYSETPVIFVSGHDSAQDRVDAYEAGGDHFLSKPIVAGEFSHKVDLVMKHRDALRELKTQSSWAQQVAFSAMAGMGDLGVIIDFFRKSGVVREYGALAQLVIEALSSWGLRGMVEIRGVAGVVDRSSDEVISPLQATVMATMRDMGRIFELKSRAVVNFEHVSILVHNLPTEEPEKQGRLRDNLALLGEGADTCVANMDAANQRKEQLSYLGGSVAELTDLMQKAAVRDYRNRTAVQRVAMDVFDGLAVSVNGLGLTDIQHEYIGNMVRDGIDELTSAFEEAATIQRDFTEILVRLQRLAGGGQIDEV